MNFGALSCQISWAVLGQSWIKTMIITATLFPGTCVGSVFLMNFVAWGYRSSQAIPFGTMVCCRDVRVGLEMRSVSMSPL